MIDNQKINEYVEDVIDFAKKIKLVNKIINHMMTTPKLLTLNQLNAN